jgi:hypothetical protein
MLVDLFVLTVIAILLRCLYLLIGTTDEWVTFWMIKRHKKKWINHDIADTFIQGRFSAPQLHYAVIAHFPEKYWGIVGNVLNIAYDLASVLIVYAISFSFASGNQTGSNLPFWSALIFSTTPILFSTTGRLKGVKARTFGSFLSLVYFVGFFLIVFKGQPAWFIVCVFAVFGIIHSSFFAIQSVLFFSIFLAFYLHSWLPVGVLALSAVPSFFVGATGILKQKWAHLKWYFRSSAGTTAEARGGVFSFFDPKEPKTAKRVLSMLANNPIALAIFGSPAILAIFYLLSGEESVQSLQSNAWLELCLGLLLASLAVFVITSIPPFTILGQAERYFEYSAPFFSTLGVVLLINTPNGGLFLTQLLLVQISIILLFFIFQVATRSTPRSFKPLDSDEMKEVIAFLNKTKDQSSVLTVPAKLSYIFSFYLENPLIRFFHMFANQGKLGFNYMLEDLKIYNWPNPDIQYWQKKYGVRYLIVAKDHLAQAEKRGFDYNFPKAPKVLENHAFSIYEVGGPK